MRIVRRRVRAVGSTPSALLVALICAGLFAVTIPCGAFCAESSAYRIAADAAADSSAHRDRAEADSSSHCSRMATAQDDAASDAPVDCCNDDCNACGIDRISVPGPTWAVQLVVPDHAPTLGSMPWRTELEGRVARTRARSPDDAPAHLLDVLSRTTTLLI